MREETLIEVVNDIDDIRYKLEDIHQNIMEQPDYWEKLKHQYAGMAMQGMLSNCEFPAYSTEGYYKHNIANNALEYATALVNRLKEDSQCEK